MVPVWELILLERKHEGDDNVLNSTPVLCRKCETYLYFDTHRNEYYCVDCEQYFTKQVIEELLEEEVKNDKRIKRIYETI